MNRMQKGGVNGGENRSSVFFCAPPNIYRGPVKLIFMVEDPNI